MHAQQLKGALGRVRIAVWRVIRRTCSDSTAPSLHFGMLVRRLCSATRGSRPSRRPTLAAPIRAVRAVHLEDLDTGVDEMSSDAGAVAPGALDRRRARHRRRETQRLSARWPARVVEELCVASSVSPVTISAATCNSFVGVDAGDDNATGGSQPSPPRSTPFLLGSDSQAFPGEGSEFVCRAGSLHLPSTTWTSRYRVYPCPFAAYPRAQLSPRSIQLCRSVAEVRDATAISTESYSVAVGVVGSLYRRMYRLAELLQLGEQRPDPRGCCLELSTTQRTSHLASYWAAGARSSDRPDRTSRCRPPIIGQHTIPGSPE